MFRIFCFAGISKRVSEWCVARVRFALNCIGMDISETEVSVNRRMMQEWIDVCTHLTDKVKSNPTPSIHFFQRKKQNPLKKNYFSNRCTGKLEQSETVTAVCTHQKKGKVCSTNISHPDDHCVVFLFCVFLEPRGDISVLDWIRKQ